MDALEMPWRRIPLRTLMYNVYFFNTESVCIFLYPSLSFSSFVFFLSYVFIFFFCFLFAVHFIFCCCCLLFFSYIFHLCHILSLYDMYTMEGKEKMSTKNIYTYIWNIVVCRENVKENIETNTSEYRTTWSK